MDKAMNLSELLNEYEHLLNVEHNMNLYIEYIEKKHPDVFQELEEFFDGLPGYSGVHED